MCQGGSAPTPPTSGTVTLQSKSNNKFVDGGNIPKATADASSAGKYQIIWIPGGYNIKSISTGNYLTGANGGTVSAGTVNPQGWESFRFEQNGDYWAILASSNKRYVTLQSDNTFTTTSQTVSDATLFKLNSGGSTPTSAPVAFKGGNYTITASNGQFVHQGKSDVGYRLDVSNTKTVFQINANSNGYTFKSLDNSQYVTADNAGASPLTANRGSASGWETFNLKNVNGNVWMVQALANKKLVTAQSDNTLLADDANTSKSQWTFNLV